MIYDAARGSKLLWVVPNAYHTAALGFYPEEFRHRVLTFFGTYANSLDLSGKKKGLTQRPQSEEAQRTLRKHDGVKTTRRKRNAETQTAQGSEKEGSCSVSV